MVRIGAKVEYLGKLWAIVNFKDGKVHLANEKHAVQIDMTISERACTVK